MEYRWREGVGTMVLLTSEERAKLPQVSPKTSWDLFEATVQAIQKEPRRVNMRFWRMFAEDGYPWDEKGRLPPCGTVGCIAGWMDTIMVAPQGVFVGGAVGYRVLTNLVPPQAREDADYLFNGSVDESGERSYPFPAEQEGTPAYAESVIANVKRFMGKWEAELKAFILPTDYGKVTP